VGVGDAPGGRWARWAVVDGIGRPVVGRWASGARRTGGVDGDGRGKGPRRRRVSQWALVSVRLGGLGGVGGVQLGGSGRHMWRARDKIFKVPTHGIQTTRKGRGRF
jgi:hypothetical protein